MPVGSIRGALTGVRVLDLSRLFPFAYGTQLLVDLGADVVKVEQAGGEAGRGNVGQYLASNRGKRSATVDLRRPEGRDVLLRLVTQADVVVESFRPGYLDSLGVGFEALSAAHDRVILCSVSGYNPDGALRSRPGHDLNYLSLGGGVQPHRGALPMPPAISVVDLAVGFHLTACINAALLGVARGEPGVHLQISMADVALSLSTASLGFVAVPSDNPLPFPEFVLTKTPCYRLWRTADDRWISLCNIEPKFWAEFLDVIQRPDLSADALAVGPRAQQVIAEIGEVLASRTLAEWDAAFGDRDVCYAPVLTPAETLEAPEFTSDGLLRRIDEGVEVLFPGTVDGVRPERPVTLAAPGEHTRELLLEAGYGEAEVDALEAEGVVTS